MQKGDRVILPTGIDPPSPVNPYQGTEFACGGRIIETWVGSFSKQLMVVILWDNGTSTTTYSERVEYENKELNHKDPNLAFLLKKMGVK